MTQHVWIDRFSRAAGRSRRVRLGVAAALLFAVTAAPAAADPLTLILLRVLRDHVITKSLEAAWESRHSWAPEQPKAPAFVALPTPPAELDDRGIRRMIDDGFVHLSSAQRTEVYTALQRMLSDPAHAESRAAILEEMATKAAAMRQMHDQLKQLSASDKQRLAAQARTEYERMSDEERQQLVHVLRTGAVPLPRDLSESILAALPH